mmetsp:Transcript_95067/g.307748  ORF Transcript_95067/g.307748 Transcript_95067/m.307748 type:complete len:160 (+) Transcript_95067:423-902(+)
MIASCYASSSAMTTADSHPTLNAQATLADAEPSTIDTKMCCGTTLRDNVQHPCRLLDLWREHTRCGIMVDRGAVQSTGKGEAKAPDNPNVSWARPLAHTRTTQASYPRATRIQTALVVVVPGGKLSIGSEDLRHHPAVWRDFGEVLALLELSAGRQAHR